MINSIMDEKKKPKIIHHRENCIGCGMCVTCAPKQWEMDMDYKANLIGGKATAESTFELEIDNNDLEANKNAAKNCPTKVIEIKEE